MVWWVMVLTGTADATCPDLELPVPLDLLEDRADADLPLRPEHVELDFELLRGDGCQDCEDALVLELDFIAMPGEQTPTEELGYEILLLEGALPDGVVLPDGPVQGPRVRFVWPVPPETLVAELDLLLELRSVDASGNRSTGSLEVEIARDALPPIATTATSCSQGSVGLWWLWFPALLLLRRDQRRTAPQTMGRWSK